MGGDSKQTELPKPPVLTLEFAYGKDEYSTLLKTAKVLNEKLILNYCQRILENRARYEKVGLAPWFVLGALHLLESSLSFEGVLHNGEQIIGTGRTTTLVPKNRGPFSSWEESARDAMALRHASLIKTWNIEMTFGFIERYNGLGYRAYGINSPYLWSMTNQYTKGKYTSDGKFDPNAVSKQAGAAAIFLGFQTMGVYLDGLMVPAQMVLV